MAPASRERLPRPPMAKPPTSEDTARLTLRQITAAGKLADLTRKIAAGRITCGTASGPTRRT